MFSVIRKRATYANVAMTLALVFAMTGGAYAAKKYLITSTKQISPKVLKELKGKSGRNGANGAPGALGPQGPQGPAGANGKDGVNGKDGASVTGKALAAGQGGCAAGGVAYTSASGASSVCNGAAGQNGTFSTGPLPSGQALTGVWATSGEGIDPVQISFPIRVSPAPTALYHFALNGFNFGVRLENESVKFYPIVNPESQQEAEEDQEAWETDCPGSVSEPKASPGFLCIYPGKEEGSGVALPTNSVKESEVPSEFGAFVPLSVSDNTSSLRGSWAVSAK